MADAQGEVPCRQPDVEIARGVARFAVPVEALFRVAHAVRQAVVMARPSFVRGRSVSVSNRESDSVTNISPLTCIIVQDDAGCGYQFEQKTCTHTPEVAGSNLAPLRRLTHRSPGIIVPGLIRIQLVHGFVRGVSAHGGSCGRSPFASAVVTPGSSTPPRISFASVVATGRWASRPVCAYCFIVNAAAIVRSGGARPRLLRA